jgi:hypothetical protein
VLALRTSGFGFTLHEFFFGCIARALIVVGRKHVHIDEMLDLVCKSP